MSTRDWTMAGVTAISAVVLVLGLLGLGSEDEPEAVPPTIEDTQGDRGDAEDRGEQAEPVAEATRAPVATPQATSVPAPTATTVADPTAVPTAMPSPTPAPTAPPPNETVETFILAFNTAVQTGDLQFLIDRLHPVAATIGGEEACRAYIQSEFSQASSMMLTGNIVGPDEVVKVGPDGDIVLEEHYTADVVLVFRGQAFDISAEFARLDGVMRWLTACS